MRNRFNFFEFKFGKNITFFNFRLTKILSAFRLNRFLFVDTLFFLISAKQPTFFEFTFEFAALGSKYGFVVFYREFTKLATGVSFFVLIATAVATVGQGAPFPP